MKAKKIGLFGGTFNPLHQGHLNVAQYALDNLNLDEVWLIPTFETPNKNSVYNITPSQRLTIIKKAISNLDNIKVKDIESKVKETSYTSVTVKKLINKYPDVDFYLLMGDDSFNSLETWKDFNYIVNSIKIVVFNRTGTLTNSTSKIANPIVMKNPKWDVSSSIVRKGYFSKVPEQAKKYISSNFLYLEEIAENDLSVNRYNHTISVANCARDIAKGNKSINEKFAYFAAIAHDITKEWSDGELYSFVAKYEGNNVRNIHPSVMHAYAGYYWWLNVYGSNNKKIANAILHHTTGCEKMSPLDKCIYVADKIASNRKFEDIEIIRATSKYNLNMAFKQLITNQFKHLKKEIGVSKIDENTVKAYKTYGDFN
ncbi:MAG: nicotinate-nucleotide adenylyltransferase [Mycoplasmataceae bacterium]|nr:nicotinate-nucleotide adenylyltransferase [Mycoplasmataceae bacterium]